MLQDDEAEGDDIELNLSQTIVMNKSMNNDTQNTRFMKRLKKVVIEGSKINKQKELQLIAEEIILQRRQNNVIEGSVLLPKDFSKADQSSTTRADETNLKSRRQRKNSELSRRNLHDRYQSEALESQKRISRRLSDQKTSSSQVEYGETSL